MGVFLVFVGFVVQLVFSVVILIKAFRVSIGWGLATLFIPFAGLFFVINNWADTKKAFLGTVAGGVLMVFGVISVASSPELQDKMRQAEEHRMAREASSSSASAEAPAANYASAMPSAAAYEPPQRSTYEPAPTAASYTPSSSTYVPSYNPPQQTAPATKTDTQTADDLWTRKPVYEQVYVDRATLLFYAEKCRKRPENTYRIPRTVALKQGLTEASCK
jgi:hypothetical protein